VELVRVPVIVRVTIFLLHAEAVVNNSSVSVLMRIDGPAWVKPWEEEVGTMQKAAVYDPLHCTFGHLQPIIVP
jgi:hypothetical protein